MGLPKTLKSLDRFDYILCGRGWLRLIGHNRKMGDLFEQTGGVRINPHALCGSPASKFGLKLASDFNSDSHSPRLFQSIPTLALP